MKIKPILSFEKETGEIYVPAKVRGKSSIATTCKSSRKHITDHPIRNSTFLQQTVEAQKNVRN